MEYMSLSNWGQQVPSDTHAAFESTAKENSLLGENDDFVHLEGLSSQNDSGMDIRHLR